MKKYIFVVLMAGLLIGCSNPADQKQPAAKSDQPAATQETVKPAAPPAPVPAAAPETKVAAPSAETAPAAPEAAKSAVESQAPAAPHTADVTSDKPVAGPGVTETVKAPAGQEAPKTSQ